MDFFFDPRLRQPSSSLFRNAPSWDSIFIQHFITRCTASLLRVIRHKDLCLMV